VRLLERDGVLRQLTGLVPGGPRAAGRVVLLRGEAGVGKTAVISRFLDGLDPGLAVLQGWCDPLAVPRPLGPLVDALAGQEHHAATRLGEALESGDSAAVYRRLLDLLRTGSRWVWVIEDAHWADGATLDLLRFVGRRIGTLPLLLVITYRDDEAGPQHPLMAAIGDVAGAAVRRIHLEPLGLEAVAVLAAGSGLNAKELHRITGGNPFYVTEILAAGRGGLGGELPPTVGEAVWARLARLSPGGRDTAYAVAVCGPRAEMALVQTICPAAETGLDECLCAGVLVADGALVDFRHELARRATLDQLPSHQRSRLHKQAMAALSQPPIPPERLAALAIHADQAGEANAAVRFGVAGAQRAAALGANREAAELYALVLHHGEAAAPADKALWLERHSFACYVCGEPHIAESSLRDAVELRRALGDQLSEAEDLRLLSQHVWAMGRTGEAAEAGRASLGLIEDLGPSPQLARSLTNMVFVTAVSFDPACADYAARAIALGTQIGEQAMVVRARCFAALASVWRGGDGWQECEAAWREAMTVEGLAEQVGMIGAAMCWTAAVHHDLDRTESYVDALSAFCEQHDLGAFEAMATSASALIALHRGDWTRAKRCAEDVLTRRPFLVDQIMARVALALAGARRGEKPAAPTLQEAAAGAGPGGLFFFGAEWAARAEIAWLAGDDEGAAAEARRGLDAACPEADPWLTGRLQRWLYLSGAGIETPTATTPLTPYQLEISGDWQAAAAEWTRRGCPYDAALAQLGGDLAGMQSALATLRRLGARGAARRAQQRLSALGGPRPRGNASYTRTDPDGLTQRQRQVAELLAAGRCDADIAAALHLSPKTVGHHVEAILAKLGVANRIQAAQHLHRLADIARSNPYPR
jgi:DNA-binding CsgD family transcriptional regulator